MDYQGWIEIDRWLLSLVNGSDSVFLDNWMAAMTSGLTWIPLYVSLLFLVVRNNENMSQIFLFISCSFLCIVLADGLADFIVKPLVQRWRPSNDPIFKYTVSVVGNMRGSDYGFFSAHAANTFSIALFFCYLVRSRLLSCSLVAWSLVNCYTRMYLGLHYPGDILAGLVWGAICGTASYLVCMAVLKRISAKMNYVSSQYTTSGYDRGDIDIVVLVLVLTFIYTIFKSILLYV